MTGARGRLSPEDQDALEDELAASLEWILDVTGALDMAPLFLKDTQTVRRVFYADPDDGVPALPPGLAVLSKGQRSKYGALATWRVVVRWMTANLRVSPAYRQALESLYFSHFGNETPYHWSGKNMPPGTERRAHDVAYDAAEGCWQTIEVLREERGKRGLGATLRQETEQGFLTKATRKTVATVLKINDHWEVERGA